MVRETRPDTEAGAVLCAIACLANRASRSATVLAKDLRRRLLDEPQASGPPTAVIKIGRTYPPRSRDGRLGARRSSGEGDVGDFLAEVILQRTALL